MEGYLTSECVSIWHRQKSVFMKLRNHISACMSVQSDQSFSLSYLQFGNRGES